MAIVPKYDSLLGAVRESDAGGGGGYVPLPVQDINKDQVNATTLYTGIAAKGTATSVASWSILKFVLSGNDNITRTVSTATDSWDNHLTASYTSSNSYST